MINNYILLIFCVCFWLCSWWQVPYFWCGIKLYDFVSGKKLVKSSFYVPKAKAMEEFPMLQKNRLCGALVYYDG